MATRDPERGILNPVLLAAQAANPVLLLVDGIASHGAENRSRGCDARLDRPIASVECVPHELM